ncbi:YcaO-like family protein [Prevotella communis]|uniref:YcaO-like family protein n=1 Tax=Prevotella communis TaxID=2913614 RepID=UPI001EDC50DE|nr:YcaO-like family protein [Prevotella communis]UKK58771.1 YcaO-like family protein [Prevotella communis]
MKKYKAATPEATVNRIKSILDGLNIPFKESAKGDGDLFCSYRLSITDNDDISIGTNGKGMSPIYAKASGYAEMMERLQNRVLIYPNPANHDKGYTFFPDEHKRILRKENIVNIVESYTPRAMPKAGITTEKMECVFLDFYHVNNSCVETIPYSFIRWVNGSNGMCAGNIPEEALIQGFNEIFERYCLQEIYLRKITPPTISEEEFEGTTILSNLRRMRSEYGMDFCIKDCSLGEGFPVIGLLVYNQDKSKYIMQLGADLSLRIALERCFTEIFQGHTADDLVFDNQFDDNARLELFNEFKRSLVYGRGRMPAEFFYETPSYSYTSKNRIPSGQDFSEDLRNITEWLKKKGYQLYIRDNSFLGFPAFHIFIPGMSDISCEFCNLNDRIFEMAATDQKTCPTYRLPLLKEDEFQIAADILEKKETDAIAMFPHNKNKANNVNRLLILMLLYFRMGNDQKASHYLDLYISKKSESHQYIAPYYNCILSLLLGNPVPTDLTKLPEWQTAIAFMAHREYALNTCDLPTCYECNQCPITEGCRYNLLCDVEDKTRVAMEKCHINQDNLSKLFVT